MWLRISAGAAAIAAILLTITLIAGVVTAQGPDENFMRGPGIAPDSPFYGLDVAYENAWLNATPGIAGRTRLHLNFSEERGAEIRSMVEQGKPEFAANATRRYRLQLNQSLRLAGNASGERERLRLRERISNATARHYFVLQRVLEGAPMQARRGLNTALNASLHGRERALNAIGQDAPVVAARHRFEFTERLMNRTNQTTDPARLRQQLRLYTAEMNQTSRLMNRTTEGDRNATRLWSRIYNQTATHLRIMEMLRTRIPDDTGPVDNAMRVTERTRTRTIDDIAARDPALADRLRNRTRTPPVPTARPGRGR